MTEFKTVPPSAPAGQPAGAEPLENPGCLGELGYLEAGLVLPAASLSYYRVASRRRTFMTILLFFLVGALATLFITLSVSRTLSTGFGTIQSAYDRGEIPVITIRDGIASVDGPQPVWFSPPDSDTLLAVDTTGKLAQIDTRVYKSGMLMTRTELHVYNTDGQYQRLPLSRLNEVFETNPLVIDRKTVSQFWAGFSATVSVVVFLFVMLWVTVVKLAYIALLALPLWGLASLIRSNTSFNTVFITGLLASIPALYLVYLLGQAKISFLFLGTLVELVLWLVFLVLVLSKQEQPLPTRRQLMLWRGVIGVPALSFFGLNMMFNIPYGAVISWVLALVTVLALVAIGVFMGPETPEDANLHPV